MTTSLPAVRRRLTPCCPTGDVNDWPDEDREAFEHCFGPRHEPPTLTIVAGEALRTPDRARPSIRRRHLRLVVGQASATEGRVSSAGVAPPEGWAG